MRLDVPPTTDPLTSATVSGGARAKVHVGPENRKRKILVGKSVIGETSESLRNAFARSAFGISGLRRNFGISEPRVTLPRSGERPVAATTGGSPEIASW